MPFLKNTAVTGFTFGLVATADGADVTTGTPVGRYTLDGGTQTVINDTTPVHEGNGQWSFDLLAAEMNGDIVGLTFSHTSAITAHFTIKTETKLVSALVDLTAAQVNTEVDTGISDAALATAANLATVDTVVDGIQTDLSNATDGLGAIKTSVDAIPTTAMRGTDSAALASVATEARLAELDAANLPADIDSIKSSVENISSGSAAISTIATGRTITTGTEPGQPYTATQQLDGVLHEVADVGNSTEFYYEFDVGGNGIPVEFIWDGYAQSNNNSYAVKAYNWGAAQFDQIGSIVAANGTTPISTLFQATNAHVGTGANLGLVRLEFSSSDGTHFATDRVLCSYAVVAQSVGYALGRVWIDTVDGTAGTESYVNGVADNPVLTLADAITIAGDLSIKEFNVASDSTINIAADFNDYNMYGVGYALDFGGFDCGNTHFYHGSPTTGTVLAATGHVDILDGIIGLMTINEAHYTNCSFTNKVTMGGVSGDIKVIGCRAVSNLSTPIFDYGTAAGIGHQMTIADWHNNVEIENFNNSGSDSLVLTGMGDITFNANCSAGTVYIYGAWKVTDNSSNITVVNDDIHATVDAIEVDTQDLQTQIGTAGAGLGDLGGMSTAMIAEVNAEVVNVMKTDVISEMAVGIPTATPTFEEAVMYIYMALRNKVDVTATIKEFHNDAGTIVWTKALSDDGTTYTEDEGISG